MANLYEIITVIHPNETDEGVQAIIGGLRKQLTDSGGTIHAVDLWGRRKLAYEIDKNDEGIYVLFHVEGPPDVPGEFRAHTRIRESVLRELVVRLDGTHEEVVRAQLADKAPEDDEQAAAQIAAAEARAAEKRAKAAAAVSGPAAEAEEAEEAEAGAEAAEPEAAEPEAAEPEAAEPEAAEPERAEPEAAEPEADEAAGAEPAEADEDEDAEAKREAAEPDEAEQADDDNDEDSDEEA